MRSGIILPVWRINTGAFDNLYLQGNEPDEVNVTKDPTVPSGRTGSVITSPKSELLVSMKEPDTTIADFTGPPKIRRGSAPWVRPSTP